MRPAEVSAVSRLMRKVILESYPSHPKARFGEAAKYTPAKLRQRIRQDRDGVFVAVAERRVVGFCVNCKDDGVLLLEWYGVDAAFRQHGLGRRLLQTMINSARRRGCHKVWCDTNAENEASGRVLRNMGFEPMGVLENHWYGQDFILWQRPLPMMRVVRDETEAPRTAHVGLRLARTTAPRSRALVAVR